MSSFFMRTRELGTKEIESNSQSQSQPQLQLQPGNRQQEKLIVRLKNEQQEMKR